MSEILDQYFNHFDKTDPPLTCADIHEKDLKWADFIRKSINEVRPKYHLPSPSGIPKYSKAFVFSDHIATVEAAREDARHVNDPRLKAQLLREIDGVHAAICKKEFSGVLHLLYFVITEVGDEDQIAAHLRRAHEVADLIIDPEAKQMALDHIDKIELSIQQIANKKLPIIPELAKKLPQVSKRATMSLSVRIKIAAAIGLTAVLRGSGTTTDEVQDPQAPHSN